MRNTETNWLDEDKADDSGGADVMYVDVDGYEGPLDLLLELARRQKVDLANVSVLALAEQYLSFIEKVRERRIDVAADYLVMAAWLAYLKSRLMVPQAATADEPSGELMAALLQFRLKRLEAMRKAAGQLVNRPQLGRQIFARGMPEPIIVSKNLLWEASLYDLLKAYTIQRERAVAGEYVPVQRKVWSLNDAREILQRLIGQSVDWMPMYDFLTEYLETPAERVSAIASSFGASLELAREGKLELRQSDAFAPLYMRRRTDRPDDSDRQDN